MPHPNSGGTPSGDLGAHREAVATGEFAAIERLRVMLGAPPPGEVWVGDDAAVLGTGPDQLLLTTDVSVAGVHADLALVGLDDFGWRAFASALSDIAAMGGRVGHAVVGVVGPTDTDLDLLYAGIAAASAAHGCPVVGGDLSGAPVLMVAVAVTGRVPVPPGPVLRSGARPGDHLVVTGPLGASASARRHLAVAPLGDRGRPMGAEAFLHPRALLAAGETARESGVTAMIDVSDGLAPDLRHLADASGVGFRLDHVPVTDGATLDDALGGGEDYELVMATPDPDRLVAAFAARGLPTPLRVGVCVAERAEQTLSGEPLAHIGWEHPFA